MSGGLPHTLGIIVCKVRQKAPPPFQETGYFKQLTLAGKPFGIRIIVFSPMDVDWSRRRTPAWQYSMKAKRWICSQEPLPSLIYDRCYYLDSTHYMKYKPFVSRFAQDPSIQLLGRPLGGKMQTHQMLYKHYEIRPYLPDTIKYTSPADVITALKQHSAVVIKPNGGSHGKGVAAILPQDEGWVVKGRSRQNGTVAAPLRSHSQLVHWVKGFVGTTRYIIQPYLELTTADGYPFDLRILVQKDGQGNWVTTGAAVRAGKQHSLTSNLHGGGQAKRPGPFLSRYYSREQIQSIMHDLRQLAAHVPRHIESMHGRLLELGLDVGIDRKGRVWLLEVNSKPGRTVFLFTKENETRQRSIQLPIQYARSLLKRQTGG
ncbi:endospore coat-associated protein YheC [Marinithermofilum abyssi]|uniref:Endospore coat-associated protein YheC n=1 Tax=Marinithermofilum abyssi TaxID=1571185 RepID=A0A8J2YDH3_9BACL|nr:YheC/YheD family protein [Marinithermofilum abyssi]GGE17204.1 endospore coat-associated protein YheC [Marinithermofilum abyssi]